MRRAQRWMLAGLAAGLGAFVLVALDDVAHGPIYQSDTAINDAVSSWQGNGFPAHAIGQAFTMIGEGTTVFAVVLVAAAWMLYARQWVLALWCVGIAGAAAFTVSALKLLFARDRPLLVEGGRLSYSFPSGHTFGATASIGVAIILATETYLRTRQGERKDPWHVWALALCAWAALAVLTGAGRVLMQEHWTSDVVASWALGLALISGLLFALGRRSRGGDPGPTAPDDPQPAAAAKSKGKSGRKA